MLKALIVCIVLVLGGCTKAELPAGKRAGGFQIVDRKMQEAVIAEMRKRDIPLLIDERGFVNFLLEDQAEVEGIMRSIQHGPNLDPGYFETIVLVNDYVRSRYEERFHEESIPFTISTHENYYLLEYSQTYGPQVDLLAQELEIEIMDYYIENQ
jgi:hypothetical protein